MRTVLIFPPQWIPLNPHFSIASLASQLRKNNNEVIIRDLNVEFYDKILSRDYLMKSIIRAFTMQDYLFNELKKDYSDDKTEQDYSDDYKKMMFKYTKIKELKENVSGIENVMNTIEESVSVMRCKERFYKPHLLVEALNNIDKALELVSLPYYPASFEFSNYNSQFFKLTFDSIKENCTDKSVNMFHDFYEESMSSILAENPDFIGISINSSSQVIPGLTLSMMLKEKSNIHVSIGGNFFGRIVESLAKKPEFFELFADSIIVEEGEKPIVEFARYIEGEIPIEQVPNLVYLEDGKVRVNEKTVPLLLNDMHFQDLDGFPLDLYFTPDIVLSTQASRGCYWRKCSFCDHDFGNNLNEKDIDILIKEIRHINEKYGISHFEFIDESVSPKYLRKMSEKIIESGLKIKWFNNARLETEFTSELLQLASNAGLGMILWGFESGSKRIMKLINKGIDIDKRLDVLREAKEAGIWNFAFIFFGFPTETNEEAMQTIELICKNTDLIHSYGRSVFTLGKHTRLRDNPEKYSITEIIENKDEFSPSYEFKTSSGMNIKERNEIANTCSQECNKAYGGPLWMYIRYREILFLYISKYGSDDVQNCKIG